MKERPIIFSAPMVRAILEGRKTQTRRVMKPQPTLENIFAGGLMHRTCPLGQPGDRLWVRETFSGPHCMDASNGCKAVPPSEWGRSSRIWYWADGVPTNGEWTRPRPSIHMPRWASRILLEITAVRVERLQDISESDACAEGARSADLVTGRECILDPKSGSYRLHFSDLWEQINGAGTFVANPFVWVIEFAKI